MDKQTLEEVTYKRNGSVHPFPLNHIQNWRKRQHVINKLKVFNWASYTNEQVIKKVRKCCVFLKDKLGNNQYFYGDRLVDGFRIANSVHIQALNVFSFQFYVFFPTFSVQQSWMHWFSAIFLLF